MCFLYEKDEGAPVCYNLHKVTLVSQEVLDVVCDHGPVRVCEGWGLGSWRLVQVCVLGTGASGPGQSIVMGLAKGYVGYITWVGLVLLLLGTWLELPGLEMPVLWLLGLGRLTA